VYTDQGSLPGSFVSWFAPGVSGPGCGQITTYAIWIVYPVASVSPGGTAASFWWNDSDTGNGLVAGFCTDYNTVTYAAA